MKSSAKHLFTPRTATLLGAALVLSQAAWAAPGGNGNGNGNGGGNGTAGQLAAIEADIAALQAEVAVLGESIALLGVNTVNADCTADPGALQAAIDAAPAAGAIITINGACNAANITGKSNLLLDGGAIGSGNGVTGELAIRASSNIQLSGINADTLNIGDSASVFTGDLSVATFASVEVNGSLSQTGGSVTISGPIQASTGARMVFSNATLSDMTQSRNTSIILNTSIADGLDITVNGDVGVFSGSHFLAQASNPNSTITINGNLFAQRLAAILLAGDTLVVNATNAQVRQNSVLDVLGVVEANFNVGAIGLDTGGGSRLFYSDSNNLYTATCDASAWTDIFMSCAP